MEITDSTPLNSQLLAVALPLILLVEDSPEDAHLLQEAFRERMVLARFLIAATPNQAFGALRLLPGSALPRLIIIDLGLPIMTGHEVLRGFMLDPAWRTIPKIILSASLRDTDRITALQGGAVDYLVKPLDFAEYERLAERLSPFLSA